MNNIIFLLTTNKAIELSIRNSVMDEYETVIVTKGNIMMELYKRNPVMVIVDIDSYGDEIVDFIKSIISIEYLPILYIHNHRNDISTMGLDEMLLPIERIEESLLWIIKQSIIFKSRYDKVMESFNAIDLLNGAVKNLLTKYNGIKEAHSKFIIGELLDIIFAHNLYLTNKPELVWVFSTKGEWCNASYFRLFKNNYKEVACLLFDKADAFKFDVFGPNGFSKNFNVNELSDISFSEKIFPVSIKEHISDINNFAGFAVGEFIFIGMNYNCNVTNYDIDIMKAVAINFDLIDTIKQQVGELEASFEYTIDALARAAEANDDITGHHIKRVNYFAKRLAIELNMDSEFIKQIENAAQMHDVGKIYVDRAILTKPGKLTDEEFDHIKKHTIYGETIIGNSENLSMAVEIARNHHEKYDGTGYPDGKKGEEIPISARIVFLADIYDALRSERPYKKGFSHEEAYDIITRGDGRVNPENFDPAVLEAFKRIHMEFNKIYMELKD
jgi:HD-GYP domain-containing protein (c-di-GMP phosphodiesterase class II)